MPGSTPLSRVYGDEDVQDEGQSSGMAPPGTAKIAKAGAPRGKGKKMMAAIKAAPKRYRKTQGRQLTAAERRQMAQMMQAYGQ